MKIKIISLIVIFISATVWNPRLALADGVTSINTDQILEFVADNSSGVDYHLIPGQIQRTVLNWQINRDGPEALTHLVLTNIGTADGNDISKLTLVTKDPDPTGPAGWGNYLNNTILTDLVLNPDGKTWSTPQSWDRISLAPGEEKLFLIFADINTSARSGKTVRLVVPPDGMTFENNSEFVMAPGVTLTSEQDFFIASDEFPIPPQTPIHEIWNYMNHTSYAWSGSNPINNLNSWDMIEFNSEIYVAGKEQGNDSYLWKTTDFNSWTNEVLNPRSGETIFEVKKLHKHIDPSTNDEYLLAFCITSTINSGLRRVFMKRNGQDWIELNTESLNGGLSFSSFEDVVSFGTYVYFSGNQSENMFRINPASLNPLWEQLPASIEGDSGSSSKLIVFNNELFVASFSGLIVDIWKTIDGTVWENTIPQSNPDLLSDMNRLIYSNFNPTHIEKHNFAIYEDKLYFSFFQLFEFSPSATLKWDMAHDINFFGDYLIFTVFNQLYAKLDPVPERNFDGGVYRLTNKTWIPILNENNINFIDLTNVPVARLGQNSFILLGNVWRASGGIFHLEQLFPQPQDLTPGADNITVLTWTPSVVFSDSIQSLAVTNKGTAEAVVDIARVGLYRNETLVSILESLPNDSRTWTLPANSSALTHDWRNDVFSIRIDINAAIRPNQTVQFSIPEDGMGWGINSLFQLSVPLEEPDIRIINFQPAEQNTVEPIEGVIAFPNPGIDNIYFAYDLAEDSNITITIYNLNAVLVSELRDFNTAGMNKKTLWQAGKMAPGTYMAVVHIDPLLGEDRIYRQKVFIKK